MKCPNCGNEHVGSVAPCPHLDDWYYGDGDGDDRMLLRIRQSLQARLEGRNEGGDIEVMRLVDEIVSKEFFERITREGWE